MSDPTSFLNWQDYLGLNEGVGETMANRTLEEADRLDSESEKASLDEYYAGVRDVNGTGTKDGLAAAKTKASEARVSYGRFMKSLSDPAERQALMEQVYGKGAVSSRDAAMMGAQGAGRIASAQGRHDRSLAYETNLTGKLGTYRQGVEDWKAGDAADDERRAGLLTKQNEMLAERAKKDEERRIDAYWDSLNVGWDPFQGTGHDPFTGRSLTQYDPTKLRGGPGHLDDPNADNQRNWVKNKMKADEQSFGTTWQAGASGGGSMGKKADPNKPRFSTKGLNRFGGGRGY